MRSLAAGGDGTVARGRRGSGSETFVVNDIGSDKIPLASCKNKEYPENPVTQTKDSVKLARQRFKDREDAACGRPGGPADRGMQDAAWKVEFFNQPRALSLTDGAEATLTHT